MANRELRHPRKVAWVMRDFLNEISSLEYITNDDLGTKAKRLAKMEKDKAFSALIGGDYEHKPMFCIYYNATFPAGGDTDKIFRKDFVSRFPSAKGFATVTISLLHELGHLQMEAQGFKIDFLSRYTRSEEIRKKLTNREITLEKANFMYFQFPEEKVATDWAIEWLKDAEHRKIAKRFEKEFFKCFAPAK